MHPRRVDSAGNNLHRFRAHSVSDNILQIMPAGHDHLLPSKQHFLGQRFRKRTVQINHHFRDALLGGVHATLVHGQSKLSADRGLNAGTVENLPLDF